MLLRTNFHFVPSPFLGGWRCLNIRNYVYTKNYVRGEKRSKPNIIKTAGSLCGGISRKFFITFRGKFQHSALQY